jgi:hypothetical protein
MEQAERSQGNVTAKGERNVTLLQKIKHTAKGCSDVMMGG